MADKARSAEQQLHLWRKKRALNEQSRTETLLQMPAESPSSFSQQAREHTAKTMSATTPLIFPAHSTFKHAKDTIQAYFHNNVVSRFTELEMKYWIGNFSEKSLVYAFKHARNALIIAVQDLEKGLKSQSESKPEVDISIYADPDDIDPEIVLDFDKVIQGRGLDEHPTEKTVRTIVAFARIKRRLDERFHDLELENEELERLVPWLNSRERLEYKPGTTPMTLMKSDITQGRLKLLAMYVRAQYSYRGNQYLHLKDMIRNTYSDEHIAKEDVKLLSSKEIEAHMLSAPVEFDKMSTDEIAETKFPELEESVAEKYRRKEQLTPYPEDLPLEMKIKRLNYKYPTELEFTQSKEIEAERAFQKQYRGSIAAMARNARMLDLMLDEISNGCKRLVRSG